MDASRNQFVRFGLVGISNTVIFLAVYYLFILIDPRLYLIGNATGFVISVLNAYYWSNRFVFQKSEEGHLKPLIKTYIAYGFTFFLSMAGLYVLVELLAVHEAIAPLLLLFITVPLNYLLNKYWSFK